MNIVQRIKQEQIATAKAAGEAHPYQAQTGKTPKELANAKTLSAYQEALQVDIGKVAAQPDIVEKNKVKLTVLPAYFEFLDHYLKSGVNYPNSVAVQCMIWLFDVELIDRALPLALRLIDQGQKMPKKFDRDMRTFVCDALYDWASVLLGKNQSASPYLDTLIDTMTRENWDVHPLCYSKLMVMLAKHKEANQEYAMALELAERAEAINPEKSGTKKQITRLKRLLKGSPTPGAEADQVIDSPTG